MNKKVEKIVGRALVASLAAGVAASVPAKAEELTVDQLYANAYRAMVNAKTLKTQSAINEARAAIKLLPAKLNWAIGEFSKQVDTVQGPIYSNIVRAIEAAKAAPTQAKVNAARALLDPLLPANYLNTWSTAVDLVQQTLITSADAAVKKAIESQKAEDIATAKLLLTELKTANTDAVKTWATSKEAQLTAGTVFTSGVTGFVTKGGAGQEKVTVTVDGKYAVTNKDGFFAITGVKPGKYNVSFSSEGLKNVEVANVVVLANKMSAASLVVADEVVLVKENIFVKTIVLDKNTDSPITGAAYKLEYNDPTNGWTKLYESTTGADGAILLNRGNSGTLAFGGQYKLTVGKTQAYKEQVISFTTATNAVENVLAGVQLQPIAKMTVSGLLKDPAGNLIKSSGAFVKLQDTNGKDLTAAVATNADGKFSFENMQLTTGTYVLLVDDNTNAIYRKEIAVTEGTNLTQDVNLVKGYSVDFTLGTDAVGGVFSTGDADTANYVATLKQGNTKIAEETVAGKVAPAVDTTLVFANDLNRVAPGTYTLEVTGDFLATRSFTITVVDKDVASSGRSTQAGLITGSTPAAVTKSTVELLNASGQVVTSTKLDNATTFKFGGLAAGDYKVRITADSYKVTTTGTLTVAVDKTTAAGQVAMDLIPTTGNVSGYVRTNSVLTPAADATVVLYAVSVKDKKEGEYVTEAAVDANGKYEFLNLVPGTYSAVIRDKGNHEIYKTTQVVVAGDVITNASYRLAAGANAALKVELVNNKGEAVQATGITVVDAFDDANSAADNTYSVTGDSDATPNDNKYLLAGLSAGVYKLKITTANYATVDTLVSIAKGATSEMKVTVFDVAALHDVSVRILGEDGAYAGGDTKVVVFKADGSVLKTSTAGANGVYTLADLEDGKYTYSIYKTGNVVVTGEVTVAGKDVTLPVVMLDDYATN